MCHDKKGSGARGPTASDSCHIMHFYILKIQKKVNFSYASCACIMHSQAITHYLFPLVTESSHVTIILVQKVNIIPIPQ